MRRRVLLVGGLGVAGLALGACSLLAGQSDAVASRLRSFLEGDPRVAGIDSLVGENVEGDLRARAVVTLVPTLTSSLLADFMTAFLRAAATDHWLVSVNATVGISVDSTRDGQEVRSLSDLWGHATAEPGVSTGRVFGSPSGASFDLTVTDDAVGHGLRLAGTDWASATRFVLGGTDRLRSCDYTAGAVDAAELDALQRLAVAYSGSLWLTMVGTERGALVVRPAAADLERVRSLVDSLGVPPSFKVTYQSLSAAPSASRS